MVNRGVASSTLVASLAALLSMAAVLRDGREGPVGVAETLLYRDAGGAHAAPAGLRLLAPDAAAGPPEDLTAVMFRNCVGCHNDAARTGNLSLQAFQVENAAEQAQTTEKIIAKLRAGMMPPPGQPRPGGDTLRVLVETLEGLVDEAAARRPNPGRRTFQRLNRAEYAAAVKDLLALEVDAGLFLPLDTQSENFDNIAAVQMLSPTLLAAYLNAAAEIGRLAIGDPEAPPVQATYTNSSYLSQVERVEGAPFGTRGGISVVHNFPADGHYVLRMTFAKTAGSDGFTGQIMRFEALDVSINGAPEATLYVDQWMDEGDPDGISMRTDPIFIAAGPQRVTAAFVHRDEGPVPDLISPHEWSLVDRDAGLSAYGLTLLPHIKDLVIDGPRDVRGVSTTPSRDRIFTCRPRSATEEAPCARRIVTDLAERAYRRPLASSDVEGLMAHFEDAAALEGFEGGIRRALQAILASPQFIFRIERVPVGAEPGAIYRISDIDLASRLSFFLWAAPPDEELVRIATEGRLSAPEVLRAQVARMLEDPRSEALATRFAAQWLRLQDLEKVKPDAFWFPDFDQQLSGAMRRETELFFHSLVREDRSFLELFTADYTFVNERLARHYGFPDIAGPYFRRVAYPDDNRRGILGHGSVLVLTSMANRTSPVLRGKWVMEVLLGTPPPPPPPGVPDLEETQGDRDGRFLTTRERMEIHRANPACTSCHMFMDPIGLALDNYDVTGKWRIRERFAPLDTRGRLYDGTPIETPGDLRGALLRRPEPLVRTFIANLMTYALGRHVEYYDQPTVRAIAREAEASGYRMSSIILGVVESAAFTSKRAEVSTEEPDIHDGR